MPNDNQPAKSYIETVMARADGATEPVCHLCGSPITDWSCCWSHSVRKEQYLADINALATKGSQ